MVPEKYSILEKLKETKNFILFRGKRVDDNLGVIIKVLKGKAPSPSDRTRFHQEYESIAGFNFNGVIKVHEVIEKDSRFSLVLERFTGTTLKDRLKIQRADTGLFLETAVQLAETLGRIHKRGVIHRDIRPENIFINTDSSEVKIGNFGISSVITGAGDKIYDPEYITGILPYISPEQTGRMNINVDYRTDLYSLGITFFEMVTGVVPFLSKDPLETIHSHIARKAPRPDIFNPELPHTVVEIIEKLMEKSPEDRYQNAFGLLADLVECRKQFEKKGFVDLFKTGQKDIADKFIIPQKIFGREREKVHLLRSYKNACSGYREIMLVSGVSGVGKSALIHELQRSIVAGKGYFMSGKYEQSRSDTPYNAIIQAFTGMIKQILTEDEHRLSQWKEKILKRLGATAGIITEIIPDLELIIGKQPAPPPCSSEDALHRFTTTFEEFASVFGEEKRPVTLFLDDIQWADPSSINLLPGTILNEDNKSFFIIFAYRHNEMDEKHPFHEVIRKVENKNCIVSRISLEPLKPKNITAITTNLLKCSTQKAGALGKIIHKKTAGNPFFVNQFLKVLYDQEKLVNDPENGWQWDDKEIHEMKVTENVVELMAAKLTELEEPVLEVVKTGACIGNRFDLETIAYTLEKSMEETLVNLNTAISRGFLRIQDDLFYFHHDRIQEAAHSIITPQKKAAYHYKIGRRILEKCTSEEEKDSKLFYITNQLNEAVSLIEDSSERRILAEFNYKAGLKAKASTAYRPAINYFENAIRLCNNTYWENEYDFILALYTEAAETSGFDGNPYKMEFYSNIVLSNAHYDTDRVRIYEIKINTCFAELDYSGAIDNAHKALELLDFRLKINPNRFDLFKELAGTLIILARRSPDYLVNRPPADDPKELAVAKILYLVGISALFSIPELYALIILKRIHHYLDHGRTPYSALPFASYGGFLVTAFNDISGGIRYGRLSLELAEMPGSEVAHARTYGLYNLNIIHWHKSLEESLKATEHACSLSESAGDLMYTSISNSFSSLLRFFISDDWSELKQSLVKKLKTTRKCRQQALVKLHSMLLQVVDNILGKKTGNTPWIIEGEYFDESSVIPEWVEDNYSTGLAYYHTLKMASSFLFNRYGEAEEHYFKGKHHIKALRSHFIFRCFIFFSALTASAKYHEDARNKKKTALKTIKTALKYFKKWDMVSPEVFHPWYMLIETEYLYLKNPGKDIGRYYDKAIKSVRETGSPLLTAIAFERAGIYYNRKNMKIIAAAYLEEAFRICQRIGISAKTDEMEKRWIKLTDLKKRCPSENEILDPENDLKALDLSTVIKSANAFSGEIVPERLIKTVMTISIESAGAMHGFLILAGDEGEWFVEAEGNIDRNDVKIMQSIPIDRFQQISTPVVNYVIRTGKPVVLDDAFENGDFTSDSYIKKYRIKSLMAAPVNNQGKMSGVIYLENNLTTNAFRQNQLEVIEMIASQAAISLENARMFENLKKAENELRQFNTELERRVEERTAELKEAYEQIKIMANTDPLTGIPNRREITSRIEYEISRFKRSENSFSLAICDIDDFKKVNDKFGHDCGDYVLVTAANLIKSSLREQDSLARWGGEEFLILLPETDSEGAIILTERIRKKLCETEFVFESFQPAISMTFGITTITDDTKSIHHYFRTADQALYQGKEQGKNQVVFASA